MSSWQRFGLVLMLLGLFVVGIGTLPGTDANAAYYVSIVLFPFGVFVFMAAKGDRRD